jgi:hypothetical protein
MKPTTTKLLAVLGVLVVAAVLTAIALNRESGDKRTSPGTTGGPGPVARVESFERALAQGDCAAVKKLVVAPGEIDCGSIAEAAESMSGIDVGAIVYRVTDSGEDFATVRVDIEGEKSSLDLVKDGGSWFVIFDTAA